MEGDFDVHLDGDELASEAARFEAVLTDGFECCLIEAETHALQYVNKLRISLLVDLEITYYVVDGLRLASLLQSQALVRS